MDKLAFIAWTSLVAIALYLFLSYAKLSSIPGPILASYSDLYRLYWVWTRKQHLKHLELHKKYGKLVRLGPNMVSVGDPAEIPNIYGYNYNFNKASAALL